MKKGIVLLVLLLVATSATYALPSYLGLRGLNRTVDAKPIGAGEFSLGLFTLMGLSNDARGAYLSGGYTEVTDTEYNANGFFTMGFGLGDKVELAGRISYVWTSLKREDVDGRVSQAGESESDDGFSEAGLAMKFSANPGDGGLWIGLMPWANFSVYDGGDSPYVTNYDGYDGIWQHLQPMFELRRPMLATDISGGIDLLVSAHLNSVNIHTNVGYHFFKQTFQFTDRRYGTSDSVMVDMEVEDPVFHLAFGVEVPLKGVTLFTEAEWRHFMKRDYEHGDGEDYDDMIVIQPGLRFPTKSGFAFDIVGSFALDNFDPEWSDLGHHAYQSGGTPTNSYRAHYAPFPEGYYPSWGVGVNLMYSSDLREGPGTGIMSGTVTDARSGDAIEGTVAFPGTAVEPAVSDAETGFYSSELPEGSVSVTVNSPGYIGASETVQVAGGVDFTRNYALQPVPATIMGSVTDIETGIAIASATVAAPDVPVSDRTGNDGLYEFNVDEGSWTITASASGYLGATEGVDVMSGDIAVVDFQLQSVAFEPIYFIVDKFDIQPEYLAVLDDIAEDITANGLVVQISGHADSDHTEEYNQTLSENRAMAVYDYLVAHGVNPSNLSTIGYGEDRPAVPNTSAANKALNRRVEFVVQTVAI